MYSNIPKLIEYFLKENNNIFLFEVSTILVFDLCSEIHYVHLCIYIVKNVYAVNFKVLLYNFTGKSSRSLKNNVVKVPTVCVRFPIYAYKTFVALVLHESNNGQKHLIAYINTLYTLNK